MTDIITQAREYVASRGTTAQPRTYDLARALVELADKQPAAQPDMVQVPRDHVQTARALMDEAAAILGDLDHPAAEWRAPIVDELTGASLILAAAPQQPAAQPSTCQWWQEDEFSETYQASCGHYHNLTSEPPHDWMKFCCYCGKPAKVNEWQPESDDEE